MQLLHGDCLELMQTIPDKSVDLVLTDPPYNIGKAKWDKIPDYINWCGKWLTQCQRVLKDNGSLYFWHNDMVQIAQLMEWIRLNTRFVFNSFIVWDKGDFRALSWKNPSADNDLRSWFNTAEYCLYYTFQDETGLTTVMLDTNNFPTMRRYFKELQEFIGIRMNEINADLGHRRAEHCFYWKTTQWDMPTPETYQQLIDRYGINKWQGYQEYESLRQEYESLRYIHKLDKHHNNIWRTKQKNNGAKHPCEKPISLLKRTINTSSNTGSIVLDPFMGSGTTGVACVQTGREFIGMELDSGYFEIARNRIEQEARQIRLC